MSAERFRCRTLVMGALVRSASAATGVPVAVLVGPSREQCIFQIRAAIILIARRKGFSLGQIGAGLGWRHHTTILNGLHRGSDLLDDPGFAELVAEIEQPLAVAA